MGVCPYRETDQTVPRSADHAMQNLSKLPAELSDQIYGDVVVDDWPITLNDISCRSERSMHSALAGQIRQRSQKVAAQHRTREPPTADVLLYECRRRKGGLHVLDEASHGVRTR